MSTPFDRESLRAQLRVASDHQRRLVLERLIEQLPDADLARLFDGLVHLETRPAEPNLATPSLRERVERHAAATRRGEYLGHYILRNAHGQREPHQTADWLATTSHLFERALERAQREPDAETLHCLRILTSLVEEVDERTDELVVFEDDRACDHLVPDYPRAVRVLDGSCARSRED